MKRLIIYDGLCIYCRDFVKILRKLDNNKFVFLEYKDKTSQKILKKQFTKIGFSLYIFDTNYVYYGQDAIKRIASILKMPKIIQEFSYNLHPYIVKGVSFLTGRNKKVQEPKGSKKIKNEVKKLIKNLRFINSKLPRT